MSALGFCSAVLECLRRIMILCSLRFRGWKQSWAASEQTCKGWWDVKGNATGSTPCMKRCVVFIRHIIRLSCWVFHLYIYTLISSPGVGTGEKRVVRSVVRPKRGWNGDSRALVAVAGISVHTLLWPHRDPHDPGAQHSGKAVSSDAGEQTAAVLRWNNYSDCHPRRWGCWDVRGGTKLKKIMMA